MKTTEILGYFREDVGKKTSKQLRKDGNVPCVLYGEGDPIHFHAPMYLFKDLLYTPEAYIVNLNVEGNERRCVLQDVQFHPVSEVILHVDFLEIRDDKPVMIEVPVRLTGSAPGAQAGGQVYIKNKKLKVKAVPGNLPEDVEVDISSLNLGNSVRVKDLSPEGYEIMNNDSVSIVQIIIPRALKASLGGGDAAEGEEGEEAVAEGAESEAAAAE